VIVAFGFVVFLGAYGLRSDKEIEQFLSQPGKVEEYKKLAASGNESQSQVSPLVKQSKKFALRINPPEPAKPQSAKNPLQKINKPAIPRPTQVTAKFKLVATCRYEQYPDRSLALLDLPAEGLKWFYQGDKVGHLVIEEIKAGSIIYKDGEKSNELFVPVKYSRSLLKKDESAEAGEPKPDSVAPATPTLSPRPPEGAAPTDLPSKQRTLESLRGSAPVRHRRTGKPPMVRTRPDVRQRKRTIEDNIGVVRKIITEPSSTQSEKERRDEAMMWSELLEKLEQEHDELEKGPPPHAPEPNNQ